MKTVAAVLVETNRPLELADLEIPPLAPGQVLVEIACSGVCQTQIGEWKGLRGPDPFLPHCLGHEACGTVLEIGVEVSRCRVGDPVILSWLKGPGRDVPGTKYGWLGRTVNAGGVTTFARHSVVSENRVTVTPLPIPQLAQALVGCAVATGFGSIWNTARVETGQTVAVFGVGGIGLCAVIAARIAGAHTIVAVDTRSQRLELAGELGATHTVVATDAEMPPAVSAICPSGFDVAVEATGQPAVMRQALATVRRQGGRAVLVGNAPFGSQLSIDPRELNQGKQLLGTWGGDTRPERDFPRYCEWIRSGQAPVEKLVDREYSLEQINDALTDMATGRALRPMIHMTTSWSK